MKQQEEPAEERGRHRVRQTFHLNSNELKRYGKRTGAYYGHIHSNDRSDGFARWSDYADDEDNDGEYIPRENTSNFSSIQKEPIGDYTSNDHTKLPEVEFEIESSKPVQPLLTNQRRSQIQSKLPKEEIKDRKESLQTNNQRINADLVDKKSEQRVPFSVAGISDIKEKKSYGRRSQEFLLELLKSQKSKREELKMKAAQEKEMQMKQKKEKEVLMNNEKKKIPQRQEQLMEIQEPLIKQSSKSEKHEKDKNNRKSSRISQKFGPRQLTTIEQKAESQKSSKPSKRVTINDKGKIKLPTDSFSNDFDLVLPLSLRKGEESSYHKRLRPVVPEDQEFLHENIDQPMDIIQQPFQENNEDHHGNDHHKEDYHQKDYQSEQDEEQNSKLKRLRKQIRITDDPEILKGAFPKKKYNKSKKGNTRSGKSRTQKESINKVNSEPEIIKKGEKNKKVLEEKKKIRKAQNQVLIESTTAQLPHNSRPQRNRGKPTQFWLGEKHAYNRRGSLIARCDFSTQQFLEMIGFSPSQSIKAHIIQRTVKDIIIELQLKPNQELYSTGINYSKMMDFFSCPQEFDLITIVPKYMRWKPHAEIIIDDFSPTNFEDTVEVKVGQTFLFRNLSDSRTFLFNVTLCNSSKIK